jgi:hypothetical protein
MTEAAERRTAWLAPLAVLLLALPALAVHVWLASRFSSYLGSRLFQDVLFSLLYCTIMLSLCRWRLLGFLSWPVATVLYFAWLFLVMSEGVSYALQDDTFNDRFFAHLNPRNLSTGIHGFPVMIGGGLLLLALLILIAGWGFRYFYLVRGRIVIRSGWARALLIVLMLAVCARISSTPHRLVEYFVHYENSLTFADSPAGRAVLAKIDPDPIPRGRLLASPGKNLVMIYMESLERVYTDERIFPGLTPNLDRLRAQGLDFPNFPTFAGAGFTMAGLFASQCGAPLFTSPFEAFDPTAGNNNDAATFHPKLVCLGDVLHAAGYRQVFMGGAPIEFSNKGLFFKIHGYNKAFGLGELEQASGHKFPAPGWGLYDSTLFELAANRFHKLSSSGRPFNLSVLTLDTHPPHGRPSPDCPHYAGNNSAVIQAVHCTDYLVGKFIGDISRDPAWKNTVVMIMSDHLRMVSEDQYPSDYPRHVLFFVLNAGQGVRPAKMYHMDIAPTLLDLMGVRTNADFIAGTDHAKPDSRDSRLQNDEVTTSVLRKVLWSIDDTFRLCRRGQLVGWSADGNLEMGGRELPMLFLGEREVALTDKQKLVIFINSSNASMLLTDDKGAAALLRTHEGTDVMTISPLPPETTAGLFSVDWFGHGGGTAHIADIPRLQGLTITSPDCEALVRQASEVHRGASLDFSKRFDVRTAPVYPALKQLPAQIDFTDPGEAQPYKLEIGWFPATGSGSMVQGDRALLGFALPKGQCENASLKLNLRPILFASRPKLDVHVMVNGKQTAVWHFPGPAGKARQDVTAPLGLGPAECNARVELKFDRPGAALRPYPANEDQRDLQISVFNAQVQSGR